MRKKNKEFITIEGSTVFINNGRTRIDATMAFKIGLAIGSKEYDGVKITLIHQY